jgi:hypothetical protein
MDLEKVLEEKLKIKYEENIYSYIQLVSNWFAYIILNNEKYIVDNSLDPTWDHSGRVVSADESFDLNDYETFGDFIENEYTGDSTASVNSGCGLYHTTYDESLDYMTYEWLETQLKPVINDLIENENKYLIKWIGEEKQEIISSLEDIDGIIEEIHEDDLLGFFIFTFVCELIERLKPVYPAFLFTRGKDEAIETIKSESLRKKKKKTEYLINREKAELLWEKVVKMYQVKYSEVMPYKVEKPLYDQKVKSLLMELCKNGIDAKEIQYIGDLLSCNFSNTVSGLISRFEGVE